MNNVTFTYTTTPLEMAESMAFNLDCLGCVCWFEYGNVAERPGSQRPVSPLLDPYIRFFHKRRDLLAGADVVADVAVLRSFPSQAMGGSEYSALTAAVEGQLISDCIPFQIIYDHQLSDLHRYRALVLAGCASLGDSEVDAIRRYVASGGRLCVIGPVATHDRWFQPCMKPALDDLLRENAGAVIRAGRQGDWRKAIHRACGDFTVSIRCKSPVCAWNSLRNPSGEWCTW
jgi:hypothetical protein